MSPVARCIFCDDPVDAQRDFQRVTGFVRNRGAAGGANTVRLKEPLPEWACMFCIERESKGISGRQGSLL